MLSSLIALLVGILSLGQAHTFGATPALTIPQGGTGTSSIPTNYVLLGKDGNRITAVSTSSLGITAAGDGTFSTTSASYFSSVGLAFSTTSSDYWGSAKGYLTSAVTSITATAPLFSSGGTTPNLTWFGISTSSNANTGELAQFTAANTVKSVATSTLFNTANASVSGLLSSTDWSTFNGKESVLTFNAPLFRSANSISWFGLSTTSQPASSNLLVSNGSNGVYGLATSTLSASSPLTGSFTQLGSGGSLGCQIASGSQAGCESAANFTLFNNKVATGSAETKGNLAFWLTTSSGQPLLGSVATGTISGSGGVTVTANQFVIGSGLTVTCTAGSGSAAGCIQTADWASFNNKVATGTAASIGSVAYWGGTTANPSLFNVATGTVSATSPVTVTAGRFVLGGAATIAWDFSIANTWTGLQTFNTGGIISSASSSFATLFATNGTSTGNFTFSGILRIPNSASLTTTSLGSCGIDTTTGQLRCNYDGTNSRVYIFEDDKGFNISTSTAAYKGAFGTSGTTSNIVLANFKRARTLTDLYCVGNGATSTIRFGNGSATTTLICGKDIAGSASSLSTAFSARAKVFLDIGTLIGTSGDSFTITPTWTVDAD